MAASPVNRRRSPVLGSTSRTASGEMRSSPTIALSLPNGTPVPGQSGGMRNLRRDGGRHP